VCCDGLICWCGMGKLLCGKQVAMGCSTYSDEKMWLQDELTSDILTECDALNPSAGRSVLLASLASASTSLSSARPRGVSKRVHGIAEFGISGDALGQMSNEYDFIDVR
jgi:hypothetical protein